MPEPALPHDPRSLRRRRALLRLTAAGSLLLIPWTIYLAYALPRRYQTAHWGATWVGYDVGLIVMLGVTAVLAWRRKLVMIIAATVAGTMLLVDSWFDVMTASGSDRLTSVLSAVVLEVPVGLILVTAAVSIAVRITRALPSSNGGETWWQLLLSDAEHLERRVERR
ncbi:MAG: hypothetical protein M3130_10845 [Actinomycetota bacterium]|nr:hypothetical protein [Actinomycetota bacterium]